MSDTGGSLFAGNDVESCARLPIVARGKPWPQRKLKANSRKLLGWLCLLYLQHGEAIGRLVQTWSHCLIQIVGTLPWFYTADLRGIKSYRAVWQSCALTMRCRKKLQRGAVWHLGGLLQSLNQGKLGCPQLAFDASWLKHHWNDCHDAMSKGMRSQSVWQGQW